MSQHDNMSLLIRSWRAEVRVRICGCLIQGAPVLVPALDAIDDIITGGER